MNKINDTFSLNDFVKGYLTIKRYWNQTGNIIDIPVNDNNLIVNEAREILASGLISTSDDYIISDISFGVDTGSGSMDDPEPANPNNTYSDQDVILDYELNPSFIGKPNNRSISFAHTLIADKILEMEEFEDEDFVSFCSACLRTNDDLTFAYKRFPEVFISQGINIVVIWEIEFRSFKDVT